MVLITASTVSAILSAGIISVFTFLLFLAGYVLQQQSVNALREAIRQPPPAPVKPVVPHKFRTEEISDAQEVAAITDTNDTDVNEQIAQLLSRNQDTQNTITAPKDSRRAPRLPSQQQQQRPLDTLAYTLALTQPSDLCSAALFAQTLSLNSDVPSASERLVLLYPSTWETSLTPAHISALTFMRELHDTHPIIFHPVEISKRGGRFKYYSSGGGYSISAHLLGELQRTQWEFSRVLYLRTPGMVVDVEAVRGVLRDGGGAGGRKPMNGWTPMAREVGHEPEVLMWERRKGLLMPRGEMTGLVGREGRSAGGAGEIQDELSTPEDGTVDRNMEGMGSAAAYVLFGNEDERAGKSELLLHFEDGLRSVCSGKGLLAGEEDRVELR